MCAGSDKPLLGRPMSTVLEDLKETDEDDTDNGSRLSLGENGRLTFSGRLEIVHSLDVLQSH